MPSSPCTECTLQRVLELLGDLLFEYNNGCVWGAAVDQLCNVSWHLNLHEV